MPTLIVTINGPFAYVNDHPAVGFLTLMAPMCSQHKAGISTIETGEQYVLSRCNGRNHPANHVGCDSHEYGLRIGTGSVNSTDWIGEFVSCPTPTDPWDARDWRFWLHVPKPNVVLSVNPGEADIIYPDPASTATAVRGNYAIGARLIYGNWDGNPIPLLYNGKPVQHNGHDVVFSFKNYGGANGLLEVEYTGPVRDDNDHEDAVDCFESLMRSLGLSWSIYIPSIVSKGNQSIDSGKLNDCKAAIARVGM